MFTHTHTHTHVHALLVFPLLLFFLHSPIYRSSNNSYHNSTADSAGIDWYVSIFTAFNNKRRRSHCWSYITTNLHMVFLTGRWFSALADGNLCGRYRWGWEPSIKFHCLKCMLKQPRPLAAAHKIQALKRRGVSCGFTGVPLPSAPGDGGLNQFLGDRVDHISQLQGKEPVHRPTSYSCPIKVQHTTRRLSVSRPRDKGLEMRATSDWLQATAGWSQKPTNTCVVIHTPTNCNLFMCAL